MVCRSFGTCHSEDGRNTNCKGCLNKTNETNPTVSEKGVSYSVRNPNRITSLKYKVDGGVICGAEERCDFLMMFPDCSKAFFIELKRGGQKWKEGVEQVENTVKLLYPEMHNYTPHLRVVVSHKAPKTNYIDRMKREKAFKKKYSGSTFEIGARFSDERCLYHLEQSRRRGFQERSYKFSLTNVPADEPPQNTLLLLT